MLSTTGISKIYVPYFVGKQIKPEFIQSCQKEIQIQGHLLLHNLNFNILKLFINLCMILIIIFKLISTLTIFRNTHLAPQKSCLFH